MEDKLRSLGILKGTDEPSSLSYASVIDGLDLEAHLPPKKVCLLSGSSVLWHFVNPLTHLFRVIRIFFFFKSTNRNTHIEFCIDS